MGKKVNNPLFKTTKETPFDEAFRITVLRHIMFMVSVLIYVEVAWLLQKFVWEGTLTGFVNLPETTYTMLLVTAGALSIASVAALFFYLPKITSPAALLDKKPIPTLEEMGFELGQAQILRITVADIPAILGLVLYLLNGSILHLIIFVIVSFLLLLLIFPRKDAWEDGKKLFENQQVMRG